MKTFNTTFIKSKICMVIMILTAQITSAESFISPPDHASGSVERFNSQMLSTLQKFEDGTVSNTFFMADISYEKFKTTYTWWHNTPTSSSVDKADFSNFIMDAHFAIRLHKNFLISVNDFTTFQAASGITNDLKMPTLWNVGPIWTSKFASLGVFFGMEIDTTDETIFNWKFVPKINTRDYPIIGFILEKAVGTLDIKESEVDSYSISFFSLA